MIDIERITKRMSDLGLTPYSAAKAAGLGTDYVRDIVRGRIKEPSGFKLARLADALECSADFLMGLSEEPGAPPSQKIVDTGHPGASHLPIKHRLAKNVFRLPEDENEAIDTQNLITIDLPEYAGMPQWIGILDDDHAAPVVPKHYYVHVLGKKRTERLDVIERDVAVVERSTAEGLVERTLWRVFMVTDNTIAARPIRPANDSDAADFAWFNSETLERTDQGEGDRISGRVIYSWRPFDTKLRLLSYDAEDSIYPDEQG